MAGTLQRNRIRVAVDNVTARQGAAMTDKLTAVALRMYQAEDVQVELGIFSNGTIIADISNLTSVTMEVKDPANLEGAPLMAQDVLFAALAVISGANWTNDTAQNALFTFTAAETNIALDGAREAPLRIYFWATTSDPRRIPLGVGDLTLLDSGYGDVGSIQIVTPGARMRNNKLQIKNQTDGLYYDFVLRTVAGQVVDSEEGAGEA